MTEHADSGTPDDSGARARPDEPVARPVPADEPAVLPDRSPDDSDEGWGERRDGEDRDDDWYERERPPHW